MPDQDLVLCVYDENCLRGRCTGISHTCCRSLGLLKILLLKLHYSIQLLVTSSKARSP